MKESKNRPQDYFNRPEAKEMTAFTVRVPLELRIKIKEEAGKQMLSINHLVESLLYYGLDNINK